MVCCPFVPVHIFTLLFKIVGNLKSLIVYMIHQHGDFMLGRNALVKITL